MRHGHEPDPDLGVSPEGEVLVFKQAEGKPNAGTTGPAAATSGVAVVAASTPSAQCPHARPEAQSQKRILIQRWRGAASPTSSTGSGTWTGARAAIARAQSHDGGRDARQ